MSTDNNIWGIHGGRTGDADSLFLTEERDRRRLDKMGDASKLKPTREAFKAEIRRHTPDKKPAAIPNKPDNCSDSWTRCASATWWCTRRSMIERFTWAGSKASISTARSLDARFPHQRAVKWLRAVPRTHFTQGALYEIGSAMSLFQ